MRRILTHMMAALALSLVLIGATLSQPAAALDFPALTGRVVDQANILDAQTRTTLTEKLAALEAKTTSQLVVVTLRSLQGTTIEDYGVQLGRHWGIGQKGKNNGALLIVAPTERKVRVEVGYGLEGALTDALTKFIIENSILPRFRAADFPGGIKRGVDDLILVMRGEGEEFKKHAVAQQAAPADSVGDWVIAVFVIFIAGIVGLTMFIVAREIIQGVKRAQRSGKSGWTALSDGSSSSSSSWSSSSSSDSGFSSGSFSGGGGSFGGGGSSGSW